ncbi:MAG: phasin family protein [Pseudomonadales bacterium]|nr:phasin family protein [Pseudomonadales bacterium]
MTDRNLDVNAVLETYRSAYAPFLRAQQEGLKAFERLAREQYAVAGDYLEFSLDATKAAMDAKTGEQLVAVQRKLGEELNEKIQKHAQRFAAIATESQKTVTELFGDAAVKATAGKKKAA